jgi:hypothetical protein
MVAPALLDPARRIGIDGKALRGVPRSVPACAASSTPAYPRLRAEHMASTAMIITISGSSPPARGTLPPNASLVRDGQFIPACAGNTG